MRVLSTLSALALFALPAAGQGMPEPPTGRQATITGTVVDLSCRFTNNLTGDGHRMCAQVCADRGVPLVILGSDGQIYLPTGEGMPSDGQNERLKEFAEQQVRVTGLLFEAGAATAIRIQQVRRAP